jgi:PKD domain/Secretion system C-terminal sorting domain
MKLYLFTILLLISTISKTNAQILADFESSASTPILIGTEAKVIDNPYKVGNLSNKVVTYKKEAGNWRFIGLEFGKKVNIGQNDVLTFKVYSTTVGRIFAKLWDGSTVRFEQWTHDYNTKQDANKWVECKVDLSTVLNKDFSKLDIAVGVDNEAEGVAYIDDVKLSNSLAKDGEPVINLVVSKNIISVDESITLDASKSIDYDGSIVTFNWNFSDGTNSNGAKITKQFTKSGNFNASLTITDNDKKSSKMDFTIYVLPKNDKISQPFLLSNTPKVNQKIEYGFVIKDTYKNVFDSDEIAIDAIITQPDQKKLTVPCFYYVKGKLTQNSWKTDTTIQHWMLRFISSQTGSHKLSFKITDKNGSVVSQEYSLDIQNDTKKGGIKIDPDNKQYYRFTTGEPYYPLGINVGWNSIQNYTTIINNLASSNANLVRYWQVPFNRQALEWKNDGYTKGIGVYSQEAAAISDSLFNLSETKNINLQLVLFQHGMFSENVNSNWADNPYNAKLGGPLAKAEEFFYNETAKKSVKKLLRYAVARWGYSTNLFAWELFNEVQFTGVHPSQSATWRAGVLTWHDEMGKFIKSIDPFKHIITTSADDKQCVDMDKLEGLDVVQYHLYDTKLLTTQNTRDADFRAKLSRTAIINGEYGLDVTTADVPFETQRMSILTGIFNQVPHLMWLWDNYTKAEWANLFKIPAAFLKDKDFVKEGNLLDWKLTIPNPPTLTFTGFNTPKKSYALLYDDNLRDDLSGIKFTPTNLKDGKYKITFTNIITGAEKIDSVSVSSRTVNQVSLPTFSKGIMMTFEYKGAIIEPLLVENEEPLIVDFKVYPNPTKGVINISYLADNQNIADFFLLDFMGKELANQSLKLLPRKQNDFKINLGDSLNEGLYFIILKSGERTFSRKIIYQK